MTYNKFKNLINFEYDGIHRAQPTITKDDIFEIYYEGSIMKLFEPDYPINIGMFDLDILNLDAARKFGEYDELIVNTLGGDYDALYSGSLQAIDDNGIDLEKYDRVVFLKNVIVLPKYRGNDILPELIKSVYITQYSKRTLFMVNATPLQSISSRIDEYYLDYYIDAQVDGNAIGKEHRIPDKVNVKVGEYFHLNSLPEEDEKYFYKLYAKMQKLNMTQMVDTPFFYYESENDILEMIELNKIDVLKFI